MTQTGELQVEPEPRGWLGQLRKRGQLGSQAGAVVSVVALAVGLGGALILYAGDGPPPSAPAEAAVAPSPSSPAPAVSVTAASGAAGGSTPSQVPASPTSGQPSVAAGGKGVSHNCANKPSVCGFPDATTSGVRTQDAQLKKVPTQVKSGTGWHYDQRGYIVVDGDGAVLDSLLVEGSHIEQYASRVTISNTKIVASGATSGIALRSGANVTIDHVEIAGTAQSGPERLQAGIKDFGGAGNVQIRNVDISKVAVGIQVEEGTIQNSYIHDLAYADGDKTIGIASFGGARILTIKGNTVLNPMPQTAAIGLFQDSGGQTNRVIDGNLLAGGGYILCGGQKPDGTAATGIKVMKNRFSRLYYPTGGTSGALNAFDKNATGSAFTGNIWDDSGQELQP